MIYKNAAIVGLGLMGGSLAGAFRKYNVCNKISGITRSDAYIRAKDAGLIDEGFPLGELSNGLNNADLVILALPVEMIINIMPEVVSSVKDGCVITDVGSIKTGIMEKAASIKRPGVCFIGGHPMTGLEKTGFEAGYPDLYNGRPYAVVSDDNTPDNIKSGLIDMIKGIKALPIELDCNTHDKIAAGISHMPQVLSIALMNMIGRKNDSGENYFDMSGPAFQEMTRIAGSAFSVWKDILKYNSQNVKTMISEYIKELNSLHSIIDKPEMKDYFKESNRFRNSLMSPERNK